MLPFEQILFFHTDTHPLFSLVDQYVQDLEIHCNDLAVFAPEPNFFINYQTLF